MEPNYDFINSSAQPTKAPGSGFLQDPKNRMIAAVVFVVGFLTLVILIFGFILSLGGTNNDNILAASGHQSEIARISGLGLRNSGNADTRAKVSTLQSFIVSDLAAFNTYLAANGGILSEEILLLEYTNGSVEDDLSRASERGAYDEKLLELLDAEIAKYKASLQAALNDSPKSAQKEILDQAATNIITYSTQVE